MIERKTGEKMTINQVKIQLFTEYSKLMPEFSDKIVDILILEGKKTLGDQVKSKSITFASFISAENYFLTPFDIWLLVCAYKIPSFFISQKHMMMTDYEELFFHGYGDINDKFAFIVIPGLRSDNIPSFRYIESDTGDAFISLSIFKPEDAIHMGIESAVTINEYLQTFTKRKTTVYVKKRPLRIEEDLIEDQPKPIIESTREIDSDDILLVNLGKKTKPKTKVNRPPINGGSKTRKVRD